MTAVIVDGTGKGYAGKINKYNQFHVYSEAVPSEGLQSQSGNAFIIHYECHLAAASSGGLLHILNNEPNYDLEVTRIYIDSHTITPTDLIVTQVFDATIANGVDVSESAIVQKNRGSSNTFNLTITASNASSDMTYTGGTQYHAFPVKTMSQYQRNMNGTNILARNQSILWGFKTVGGGNATDAEIISFSVNLIRREVE